ncbi:MAG: TonB-dependent receptor, partial [Pseudomonadota bacterium]
LFSDWTDRFSTEFKLALSEQITGQVPLGGGDFANFEIETPEGSVSIGPDFFRHANELENELLQVKATGTYDLGEIGGYGSHLVKFGVEYEEQDVFNLFVPGSEGEYSFDSIADFQARTASSLFYQNAVTNDEVDGAASFGFEILSLYVQDEWQFNEKLTVIAGLRYEDYQSDDTITENPNFEARYGFSNANPVDASIVLPRIGFNYEYNDIVTFRGGLGRFSGGSPNVWVSNNYSNNGVTLDTAFQPGPITGVDGFNIPQNVQDSLTAGDGDVNVLDPDFEIPSLWRANVGADLYFEDLYGTGEWEFGIDYVYGSNENAPFWNDISCGTEGVAQAPDGRPIYNCGLDAAFVNSILATGGAQALIDFYDDGETAANGSALDTDGDGLVDIGEAEVAPEALFLTNIDKGKQEILTLKFRKPVDDWGMTFGGSYTWQDATDAHSGTSSTASSNYSDYASFDRQNARTAVSNYQREHELKLFVDWEREFFDGFATRATLFGNHRSGQPFSYTYDYSGGRERSLFGIREGRADDEGELFYVPTGANDPLFNATASFGGDAAVLDDFFTFLGTSGLNDFAGDIALRNEFESSDYTTFDLRLQQEFPAFFPDTAKGTFFLDIENLGNLLNSDWGQLEQVRYEYFQPVANVDIVDGQYVYTGFPERSEERVTNSASLWQVQLGVKYAF